MTRFEALVSLNLIADIGSVRLNKLLEIFDKPQNLFTASQAKLGSVAGIGQGLVSKIRSFNKEILDKELETAKKLGLKILTLDDAEYPRNLKNIPAAPLVIYIKGRLTEEDKHSVAIVGSRRASFYGITCSQRFAFDLSNAGFTIVSGMARGIDTYAHRGALNAKGRTIAVMGSGFNNIYPQENKELAEEICRSGAVISEFPMDTLPLRQNFPRRNRIISGLSLGVLVAEAAKNSGALITADFALEQGREVFCLPGRVDCKQSFGTNGLIKQGAKLVSCVEDITEEFTPVKVKADNGQAFEQGKTVKPFFEPKQDYRQEEVYSLISSEPVELDELLEKANMDIPLVSGILLELQIKKLVKQLPGKQFVRS